MRVLLTRPRADSEALAVELGARGIDCLVAPVLEIEPVPGSALDLARFQAVLVTSANGARALVGRTSRRDVPVLAVGDGTARVLQDAGFAQVASADGAGADLVALAARELDPSAGPVLRVRGREAAGAIRDDLAGRGFTIEEAVLYRAERSVALPEPACAALDAGKLDAALFFSPRSAATFVTLAHEAGVAAACARVAALCLSEAVAAEVHAVPWRCTAIARHPRKADMLALLDDLGGAREPEG